LMYDKIENYKLLGQLGENPRPAQFNLKQPDDDDPLSLKYGNSHRYARHKRRRNYVAQSNIREARSTGELTEDL